MLGIRKDFLMKRPDTVIQTDGQTDKVISIYLSKLSLRKVYKIIDIYLEKKTL